MRVLVSIAPVTVEPTKMSWDPAVNVTVTGYWATPEVAVATCATSVTLPVALALELAAPLPPCPLPRWVVLPWPFAPCRFPPCPLPPLPLLPPCLLPPPAPGKRPVGNRPPPKPPVEELAVTVRVAACPTFTEPTSALATGSWTT